MHNYNTSLCLRGESTTISRSFLVKGDYSCDFSLNVTVLAKVEKDLERRPYIMHLTSIGRLSQNTKAQKNLCVYGYVVDSNYALG